MRSIKVLAPAKINLYLRVLGKRPDGYHDLETLFQAVGLYDELIIEESSGRSNISVPARPDLECDENLALGAVRLLEELSERSLPVSIRLIKRIPTAAGLGGGSSDAAAALIGVNELFDLGIPIEKQLTAAVKLGADVPFFLRGGTAVGEGVGDILSSAPFTIGGKILLINPGFSVPTAQVFREFSKTLTRDKNEARLLWMLDTAHGPDELLRNDLQETAERLFPEIRRLREAMEASGFGKCLMSGSGPTVFGFLHEHTTSEDEIRSKFPQARVFVVEPVNHGVRII
jgi:4-diphosphocytidyl-2-C-methyl-D-erythritol kinase